MDAVRAVLYTERMADTYFTYEIKDVEYKQTLLTHTATAL